MWQPSVTRRSTVPSRAGQRAAHQQRDGRQLRVDPNRRHAPATVPTMNRVTFRSVDLDDLADRIAIGRVGAHPVGLVDRPSDPRT